MLRVRDCLSSYLLYTLDREFGDRMFNIAEIKRLSSALKRQSTIRSFRTKWHVYPSFEGMNVLLEKIIAGELKALSENQNLDKNIGKLTLK